MPRPAFSVPSGFRAVVFCALMGSVGESPAAPAAEIFAGADVANKPLALSVNDAGRLLVSANGGRSLAWLDDADSDGRAETTTAVRGALPADPTGPGGAVLALAKGKILFGREPDLWLFSADPGTPPTVAASAFGTATEPALSGLHALTEGADGWIYFTCGERGYHFRDGSRILRRSADSGAVFRCREDGGGIEVFATGFQNPAGLALDAEGTLWVMDEAEESGKARLIQVTEGAEHGWRGRPPVAGGEWKEDNAEVSAFSLPAAPTMAITASALIAGWKPGTLLAADRSPGNAGGIAELTISVNAPPAARDLWRGGAVTDVTAAPDGVLYFTDHGETPGAESRGRVWRLDATPDTNGPPQGPPDIAKLTAAAVSAEELAKLLTDVRPRVRLRAQQALASRGFQESLGILVETAAKAKSLVTRLHGLWGLAALVRKEPALAHELTFLWSDPLPAIRAAAARAYGESARPGRAAPAELLRLLTDEIPAVRAAAACALARLRVPDLAVPLVECAERNAPANPALRHSLAAALAAGVPAAELAALTRTHSSAEVSLTAVLALRRLASPELAAFLRDPDPLTAAEATRAVYDLPVPAALPALAETLAHSLSGGTPLTDSTARRALAAAWRFGTAEDAGRVADFAARGTASVSIRKLALSCLENWDRPPETDPLFARPFRAWPREPGTAHTAIRDVIRPLAEQADNPLATDARRIAELTGEPAPASALTSLLRDAGAEPASRARAFRGLVSRGAVTADFCRDLMVSAPPEVRMEAMAWLMKKDPVNASALAIAAFLGTVPEERRLAVRTLDHLPGNGNENERLILELTRSLANGTLDTAIQVEVLEALDRRDSQGSTPWRKSTELRNANLTSDLDPLAQWRVCLTGGDPREGRRLFEQSPNARCSECHSIGGEGGLSGPELDGVGTRLDARGLLRSMVHPSADFAHGFQPREGESPLSPMPPAGAILTPRELRDLIAWLQTLTLP